MRSEATSNSLAKRLYLCLGYASLMLGGLGIILPLLPTTPFLLLAVWSFIRSNPALAAKLEAHPRFGPLLVAWRKEKAVPRRAKVIAVAALAGSYGLALVLVDRSGVLIVLAIIMSTVALYLLTRPLPSSARQVRAQEGTD